MSLITMTAADTSQAAQTVAQSLARPKAAAASAAGATQVGSTQQQGISSNDFLTLLVTEMKNQDPTQPTDPNAYIQQLVGVNSLQQLIAINQDLSSTATTSTTPTGAQSVGSVSPS